MTDLSDPAATLWRITAPHYTAGLITVGTRCVHAAPILRWAVGKELDYLIRYFHRKRFKVERVGDFVAKGKGA